MTASERRKEILEVLSMRRVEQINNLAFQFGVSEKTIRRDILSVIAYTFACVTRTRVAIRIAGNRVCGIASD